LSRCWRAFNDIGFGANRQGPRTKALDIIDAYRQIIALAHASGALVFGGTLLPYQGAQYHDAAGEQMREIVNEFIRRGGAFDGVIDFESAIRDPRSPMRMLPAYDSGDHLHPNDRGYAAMADAIPLKLFDN